MFLTFIFFFSKIHYHIAFLMRAVRCCNNIRKLTYSENLSGHRISDQETNRIYLRISTPLDVVRPKIKHKHLAARKEISYQK
jgi:hypothetical protein